VVRGVRVNRINHYFYEANRHIEHIVEAKEEVKFPIVSYEKLSKLEKFALNTLIFRFSKLQDLIGVKIFREFLETSGLSVAEFSFFDILKEIEKEGICDIDSWNELRKLRNDIAHEYPEELDEMIEKINLLMKKSDELIEIFKKIEDRFAKIDKSRD
jgi:hypothetical protein